MSQVVARKRRRAADDDGSSASALAASRRLLPIWEARKALLAAVAKAPALVLSGETGCGKTTQIPQFLLAAGYAEDGLIGVTQPRRVAAMSVARRVAEEMGVDLGDRVGYSVRFDDCTSESTKIRYVTDGMLLREAVVNPALRRYAVIIIDEAHERSLQTDMMLAILKRAQASRAAGRKPLKLIVMSATLETETFCAYFGDAPAVQVLGRQFPVAALYAPAPQPDYLEAATTAAMQVHAEEAAGDILVFLTGQEDIEAVGKAIRERAAKLPPGSAALSVHPLYAALPPAVQLRALRPATNGIRKVILATNIAETSVTIDGVVYVIDCGLAKVRMYHAGKRIDSLLATPISKANARQRAGRAGRQQPGKCFRLYTEETFAELAESSVPEIQRTSLASAILALKALRIDDVLNFDFVAPPTLEAMGAALEQLLALGALTKEGDLSDEGVLMSKLPLDPTYSKALLVAGELRCALPMLSLIAMLSVEGAAFITSASDRAVGDEARRRFVCPQGDTLTLVNVLAGFAGRTGTSAKLWCEQHRVNRRTVEGARQIRQQLFETCRRLAVISPEEAAAGAAEAEEAAAAEATRRFNEGLPQLEIDVNRSLRRCLTAAFFMQAALRQPSGEYLALVSRETVAIHPSSVLFSRRVPCALFNELLFTTRLYMRDLTQIEADWLPELAPQFFAQAPGPATGMAPIATAGHDRLATTGGASTDARSGLARGGSRLAEIARERERQQLQ